MYNGFTSTIKLPNSSYLDLADYAAWEIVGPIIAKIAIDTDEH